MSFHNTLYAKNLFESYIPQIVRTLKKIHDEIAEQKKELEHSNQLKIYELDLKQKELELKEKEIEQRDQLIQTLMLK